MKNSFFLTILLLHLFSCAPEKTKTIETEEIDHSERDDQKPYVNPNAIDSTSEFSLFQVKRTFTLTSGEKIDFRNFTYEDCILRNGVSYIDSDFGFDTTRLIKDHQITDSLFLIELYEYYGGGSSELIKIIYLYKREPYQLKHLSTLTCSGNYPIILNKNKLVVKADNYNGGKSARCCPWKYEIAEFEITTDSLRYISRKFQKIPE